MLRATSPTRCLQCCWADWPWTAAIRATGLAAALLKHFLLKALEVAELTGVRLVLVHAKDSQSASFYRHFGFEPSPLDDLTLMLLVKDISP